MKTNYFFATTLFLLIGSMVVAQKKKSLQRSTIIVPPKQIVVLNYPLLKGYNIKIWNESNLDLGISARNQKTDSIHKSTLVAKKKQITFSVDHNQYLQLENRFFASLKIEYTISKGPPGGGKEKVPGTLNTGFYLVNNTKQILSIDIPGIISPKLTPYSKTGVDLPLGQQIFLKTPRQNLLIFTVTDTIRKGAHIDVADLIDVALNREEDTEEFKN